MKKNLISLITLLFLYACGIENPEAAIEFNAPLGLSAIKSNNSIFLSFWGFNNETYFEGYNIYISLNNADLVNFNILGERVLSNQTATNKPTIEIAPFSDGPRYFTFEVTTNYFITTNNTSYESKYLMGGRTYFFTVRATGNGIISRKYANIVSNRY